MYSKCTGLHIIYSSLIYGLQEIPLFWLINYSKLFQEEDQQVTLNVGEQGDQGQQQLEGLALNDFNDGTVLYIDPNDPQAAALLQQAGLTITEDGTVIGVTDENAEQGGQNMQLVQGDPEVITAEQQDDPGDSNQLGSMMEGTDNASTEVPQDLFMNSEDLVDSKDNIVLDAAQVAAAVRQNQLELATPPMVSPFFCQIKLTNCISNMYLLCRDTYIIDAHRKSNILWINSLFS